VAPDVIERGSVVEWLNPRQYDEFAPRLDNLSVDADDSLTALTLRPSWWISNGRFRCAESQSSVNVGETAWPFHRPRVS
jgi:hypothetical protein